MKFSTNDEVLTLLEEGSTGTMTNGRVQGLFCKESKAEGRNDPEEVYYGDDYRMVCNVDYFAVGVYFKLQAKVKNQIKFQKACCYAFCAFFSIFDVTLFSKVL